MYIFPTNEPLPWSAQEENRMRPLVLFVFVRVWLAMCLCTYVCFVSVCLSLCWGYTLSLAYWLDLGQPWLCRTAGYSDPYKAKTPTNSEGYSARALSFI